MAVMHDLVCDNCAHRWTEKVDVDKLRAGECDCPACEAGRVRIEYNRFPGVMNRSLPDGWRMKNDSTYKRMVEIADLEIDRADLPVEKRGDIDRELKRLHTGKGDEK